MEQRRGQELAPIHGAESIQNILELQDATPEHTEATLDFLYSNNPAVRAEGEVQKSLEAISAKYRQTLMLIGQVNPQYAFSSPETKLLPLIFPGEKEPALSLLQAINKLKTEKNGNFEPQAYVDTFNTGMYKLWQRVVKPDSELLTGLRGNTGPSRSMQRPAESKIVHRPNTPRKVHDALSEDPAASTEATPSEWPPREDEVKIRSAIIGLKSKGYSVEAITGTVGVSLKVVRYVLANAQQDPVSTRSQIE